MTTRAPAEPPAVVAQLPTEVAAVLDPGQFVCLPDADLMARIADLEAQMGVHLVLYERAATPTPRHLCEVVAAAELSLLEFVRLERLEKDLPPQLGLLAFGSPPVLAVVGDPRR